MISTYTVSDYNPGDTSVEIVYKNSEDLIHKRVIHIPYKEDGTIDPINFELILREQLEGLNNKIKVGAITFENPNQENNIL